MVIGHENLGQVIEVGQRGQADQEGRLGLLPFNVRCGYCRNCERGYTGFCLVHESRPKRRRGLRLLRMGPYRGGQAELLTVPYGDFNCLRLHEDAEEKETDYVMLADIWPTGWHATELAGVKPGETGRGLRLRPGRAHGGLLGDREGRGPGLHRGPPPRPAQAGGVASARSRSTTRRTIRSRR